MVAYRQGNADVSIRHFQRCLEIFPDRWDVWQHMAAVHSEVTGDIEESVRLLRCGKRIRTRLFTPREGAPPYRFLQAPWGSDLTHTASLEYLIKREILQDGDPRNIVLLAHTRLALLDKMAAHITIVSEKSALPLPFDAMLSVLEDPFLCESLDGLTKHWWHAFAEIQHAWETARRGPLLSFSAREREKGLAYLRRLGVPDGAWFVCLDTTAPDMKAYRPALQAVTQRGGWVICLGGAAGDAPALTPGVVDCAPDTRDDVEVFLLGACRFFIGTASGHAFVPPLFGVPCVLTNWSPAGRRPLNSRDIYIPTIYNAGSPRRLLTFGEFMAPPLGHAPRYERAQALKLNPVPNTADEIAEVVEEMLERFDGTLRYSERDETLQSAFDAVAQNSLCFGSARVGQAFLRRYASLVMNVSNF